MRLNKFEHCSSKAEMIKKSVFKGRDAGIVYCIFEEQVFVRQGLKFVQISLELFAEGMQIELVVAQAIVYGQAKTIQEAERFSKGEVEVADTEVTTETAEVDAETETAEVNPVVLETLKSSLELRVEALELQVYELKQIILGKKDEDEEDVSEDVEERDSELESGDTVQIGE